MPQVKLELNIERFPCDEWQVAVAIDGEFAAYVDSRHGFEWALWTYREECQFEREGSEPIVREAIKLAFNV